GVAFYNNIIPFKEWEYAIAPMFSLGSKSPTGTGQIIKHWYPPYGPLRSISTGLTGSTFNFYTLTIDNERRTFRFQKINPYIDFNIKKKNPRSSVSQTIRASYKFIREEFLKPDASPSWRDYYYNSLSYDLRNDRVINPLGINLTVEQGKDYVKSFMEANYRITYETEKKGLDVRVFAGSFINGNNPDGRTRFRLSGDYGFGLAGFNDYMFDHIYLGRLESKGLFARQVNNKDGGFRTQTFVGQSDQWLASFNLSSSFFGNVPIKPYINLGFYWGMKEAVYEGGFAMIIISNVLEVYFPVFYSRNIEDNIGLLTSNYPSKITFKLDINSLNPFDKIRNFKP
ncbi:MAG: hypothetical protein IH946_10985, partial [Bacteroidetes bacterium]|nr:hypothetical protein [Bacteroidota bacterium]